MGKSFVLYGILILMFILAEEFLEPIAAACVVLLWGIGEFVIFRLKEKKWNVMLLWMTLFFCLPNLLCLFFDESSLHHWPYLILEIGCGIFLGLMAYSNLNVRDMVPDSLQKELNVSEEQFSNMRKNLRLFFFVVVGHLFMAVPSLYLCSEHVSDFIVKPLLYIALGIVFCWFLLQKLLYLRRMKMEEWLPVVNERGEVVGKATRTFCHSGSKLLHPVVHLHIQNEQDEFFLQKRSMKKDFLPGIWDTAVGGHVAVNEKIEEALKRETWEELGICDFDAHFIGSYIWESERERELVFAFLCTRYDAIHINTDEVDEGRFWSRWEIEKGIQENKITSNFAHEYQRLLQIIKR